MCTSSPQILLLFFELEECLGSLPAEDPPTRVTDFYVADVAYCNFKHWFHCCAVKYDREGGYELPGTVIK